MPIRSGMTRLAATIFSSACTILAFGSAANAQFYGPDIQANATALYSSTYGVTITGTSSAAQGSFTFNESRIASSNLLTAPGGPYEWVYALDLYHTVSVPSGFEHLGTQTLATDNNPSINNVSGLAAVGYALTIQQQVEVSFLARQGVLLSASTGNALQVAMDQAAIWEIEYGGTVNISNGDAAFDAAVDATKANALAAYNSQQALGIFRVATEVHSLDGTQNFVGPNFCENCLTTDGGVPELSASHQHQRNQRSSLANREPGDHIESAKSRDFRPILRSLGKPNKTSDCLAGAGGYSATTAPNTTD